MPGFTAGFNIGMMYNDDDDDDDDYGLDRMMLFHSPAL